MLLTYFNRNLQWDLRHLNEIPCKVVLIKDDFSVEVWRQHRTQEMDISEHKSVYSLSEFVPLPDCYTIEDIEQSIISCESYPSSVNSFDSSDTFKSKHSYPNGSRDHNYLQILDLHLSKKNQVRKPVYLLHCICALFPLLNVWSCKCYAFGLWAYMVCS